MNIQRLSAAAARWAATLGFGTALLMVTVAQAEEAAIKAHWQEYDISFGYMGHTTLYSCNGLEDRLEDYLRALGARKDVHVSATGCGADQVAPLISAHIRVSLPLQGEAADPKDSVMATPKTVSLKSKSNGATGAGDCELLEQVRDRLLPELKLTSAGDDLGCVPGQAGIGSRTLKVSALIPVPAKGK